MTVGQVLSAYFDALETGRFAQHFSEDVTWTMMVDGATARGRKDVEDAINALHARLADLQTVQLVFGPHAAYLEGTAAAPAARGRIGYCVAYDVVGDLIVAMRAYGPLGQASFAGV